MKRPSFQFYPADWLSDPNVIAMTAEERGAYIQLIALMWNTEDCSLKDDVDFLARLAGVDNNVITQLYHCFNSVNGMIRHKRLDLERAKQDSHRSKRSEAGQKGMMNRWGGVRDNSGRKKESRFNQDANLIPNLKKNEPEKTANTSHSYNSVITKDNSSSSSSTSSSSFIKENIIKESPTNHILYQRLVDLCASLGLKNEVAQATFLLTIEEFREKINTTQELRDCLYWCKENKKQKITVMRIRNWFKNALSYAKTNQLRLMTKDKDKVQTQESLKSSKLYG